MKEYIIEQDCALDDGLIGGEYFPVEVSNISLTGGGCSRGALLAGESSVYSVAGAGDVNKSLAIAADDFVADSVNAVTQAYTAGLFNRDKIITGAGVSLEPFEAELRKQNIHLTSRRA